jgi:hypothetical protein
LEKALVFCSGKKSEKCGVKNGVWRNNQSNAITTDSALAQAWSSRGDSVAKIVLACAHIYDHRPEAASLLNLAALCQRCHAPPPSAILLAVGGIFFAPFLPNVYGLF